MEQGGRDWLVVVMEGNARQIKNIRSHDMGRQVQGAVCRSGSCRIAAITSPLKCKTTASPIPHDNAPIISDINR
ncbi:hypothetical protein D3C76_982490 [compost metagenome]